MHTVVGSGLEPLDEISEHHRCQVEEVAAQMNLMFCTVEALIVFGGWSFRNI